MKKASQTSNILHQWRVSPKTNINDLLILF